MAKAPWARGWRGRKHGEKGEGVPMGFITCCVPTVRAEGHVGDD